MSGDQRSDEEVVARESDSSGGKRGLYDFVLLGGVLWVVNKTIVSVKDVILKLLDKPTKVKVKHNQTEVSLDRGDHVKTDTSSVGPSGDND